jgi:hypothetical protein
MDEEPAVADGVGSSNRRGVIGCTRAPLDGVDDKMVERSAGLWLALVLT